MRILNYMAKSMNYSSNLISYCLFILCHSFFFWILSSVGDLARTCDFAHFPPINMAIRILHGWKFLLDPRKMLPPLRKCTGNKLSSGYNFWPQLRFIVLFKPNRSTKSQSKTFSKKRNFRRHTILNFDFDWQLIKKWRQEIYNLIDWLWASYLSKLAAWKWWPKWLPFDFHFFY